MALHIYKRITHRILICVVTVDLENGDSGVLSSSSLSWSMGVYVSRPRLNFT